MTRRPLGVTLVAVALVVVLVAAANPQAAGGVVQWIEIPTVGGHVLTAAVARPAAAEPSPVVVILHGTADTVVPIDDARAYEQVLHKLGKPVEARYFDGAIHQMLFRPETQASVREAMVTFLRARLVGAGPR